MGVVKNLKDKEAVKKMQDIIDASSICLFTTRLEDIPLSTRPMGTMKVDEEGYIWFFSNRKSQKNRDILLNNAVQLFYGNNSSSEYLSIYGTADIIVDKEVIEELWNPIVKTWFTGGKTDPDITVIRVSPVDAHYWDTLHNKMISMLKIFSGALTGITMDDGVEGKIDL